MTFRRRVGLRGFAASGLETGDPAEHRPVRHDGTRRVDDSRCASRKIAVSASGRQWGPGGPLPKASLDGSSASTSRWRVELGDPAATAAQLYDSAAARHAYPPRRDDWSPKRRVDGDGTASPGCASDGVADPRTAARGPDDVRCEGPGHVVPSGRAAATAGDGPERRGDTARRHRLRRVERVRWSVPDADGGAVGCPGPQVQPVPHHSVVRTGAGRAAYRPQPPRRRDGGGARDRDIGAGVSHPSNQLRHRRRDTTSQRT